MIGGDKMESAIASNVRRLIRKSGFKQYVIAEKAGFSDKAFSNMLNGRKVIADHDIPQIARALNVTPNDLFESDVERDSA
jgi:transcriptional regulator with XRE-family HTH domain